ncbi:MAG: zinc ribbon domain-containing protein [Verrucomicrobiae bacterium]|nr:zinc ribbon domain-containing protein [Verrucomicrobiae bacterium]
MPTYEYECLKCGKRFEYRQSMKDKPLTVCPKELCEGKKWHKGKVRRLLSAGAGIIFKGSGFYITDYRSEGYKQAAKKDAESATKKETTSTSSEKTSSGSASGSSAGKETGAKAAKKNKSV